MKHKRKLSCALFVCTMLTACIVFLSCSNDEDDVVTTLELQNNLKSSLGELSVKVIQQKDIPSHISPIVVKNKTELENLVKLINNQFIVNKNTMFENSIQRHVSIANLEQMQNPEENISGIVLPNTVVIVTPHFDYSRNPLTPITVTSEAALEDTTRCSLEAWRQTFSKGEWIDNYTKIQFVIKGTATLVYYFYVLSTNEIIEIEASKNAELDGIYTVV